MGAKEKPVEGTVASPETRTAAGTGGMWTNDIVFGGERLDEAVQDGEVFILLDCGIVAENVKTDLGDDAVKSGLVLAKLDGNGKPVKVIAAGTFSQPIATKVKLKRDGDLPALCKTETVPASEEAFNDAKVLTFVAPYRDKPPAIPDDVRVQFIDLDTPPH